jgi:cytochrome c556
MNRSWLAAVTLTAAVASTTIAADAPPSEPGWTGLTAPTDVIAARQGLMAEMERLMEPIDSFTIGQPADPSDLRSAAETISRILLALPHLFPPTTNLYDPAVEAPATIALPAVWRDFAAFYALAETASRSASSLASKDDAEDLRTAAMSLRAACDACHATFLRPYVAETASPADADFDFDSALGAKPDDAGTK